MQTFYWISIFEISKINFDQTFDDGIGFEKSIRRASSRTEISGVSSSQTVWAVSGPSTSALLSIFRLKRLKFLSDIRHSDLELLLGLTVFSRTCSPCRSLLFVIVLLLSMQSALVVDIKQVCWISTLLTLTCWLVCKTDGGADFFREEPTPLHADTACCKQFFTYVAVAGFPHRNRKLCRA